MPSYYRQTKENRASFGRFMRSNRVRIPTVMVAVKIAARARATAPKRTGYMAEGFKVRENAGDLRIKGIRRVRVQVYNSRRGAVQTEFGGARTKKSRTLGLAGAHYGKLRGGRRL